MLGATTEHDPESEARLAAFRHGLEELGWVDGRNLRIDYRFAGGDADRIRTYVTELVNSAPDLIVANSTPKWARFAKGTAPQLLKVVAGAVTWALAALSWHRTWRLEALKIHMLPAASR